MVNVPETRDGNIRVDFPEARGDRGAYPPDTTPVIPRRMRLTREMTDKFGLTPQCLGCRAIRTGEGYNVKHTGRCRERIEREVGKEPEGSSKVARDTERIKRARTEERAGGKRIGDPGQKPGREEGGKSRGHRGNAEQVPREQSGDVDMGDPGREKKRLGEDDEEGREVNRVRFNVFDGKNDGELWASRNRDYGASRHRQQAKNDEWVETEEDWVRVHHRPDEASCHHGTLLVAQD